MLFKCRCYRQRQGYHPKGNRICFSQEGASDSIGLGIGYKKYFHRCISNNCHKLLGYPYFHTRHGLSYSSKYYFHRSSDYMKTLIKWRKPIDWGDLIGEYDIVEYGGWIPWRFID